MKPRLIALLAVAIAYGGFRAYPLAVQLTPRPTPVPAAAAPFADIAQLVGKMSRHDRSALHDAYSTLAKSVAADPPQDPVFIDTAAVRRAHRAAMLFVWKGVLDNQAGEIPGLAKALEAAIDSRIGSSDIPMNPTLKADTAKAFEDVAKSVK